MRKGRIFTSGLEHWPRFLSFPVERGEGSKFEQRIAGTTGIIWVPVFTLVLAHGGR